LNLRKFVFGNRVVDYWNGLPDHCINCAMINDFKYKIKVVYKYKVVKSSISLCLLMPSVPSISGFSELSD